MLRLGESKGIALRRLLGTERRLARDPSLLEQYVDFMVEYLELGHIEMVHEARSISPIRGEGGFNHHQSSGSLRCFP